MRVFATFVATLFVSAAIAMPAFATILDFEDVLVPGNFISGASITSGGFQFETTTATDDAIGVIRIPSASCTPSCITGDGQYLYAFNGDQTGPFELRMSQSNGDAFNLQSFEFATLFPFVPGASSFLTLIGTKLDDTTVEQSFDYDNLGDAFQIAIASSAFRGVESILFRSTDVFPAFDNITVSQVPIPAAFPFLLTGLAGLGLARRRRKAHH